MKFKQASALAVLFLYSILNQAYGQSSDSWLENTMFQSGKINVVIAVVAVMFILIVFYLVSIDRKLKRIEKKEKKN